VQTSPTTGRRPTPRGWASALLGLTVALTAAGCAAEAGTTLTQTAGPVTVEVPADWDERVEPVAGTLVAQTRWVDEADGVTAVQVVAGCGDEDADELTIAAATRPRDALVVTGAQDAISVSVPGLDAARRTTLTLGAGRADDAESLRVEGLYGAADGGLVLVEYTAPIRRFDANLADEVMGSVVVDPAALRTACTG
jgi:hypothetical protein